MYIEFTDKCEDFFIVVNFFPGNVEMVSPDFFASTKTWTF